MSFSIREATPTDNQLIFDFINELAHYEKLSNDVTATPEILYESLFVKKQAEVLIGEEDGKAVGFALFFHNFSTFKGRACLYLEDVFIRPEQRGKGYGKALLKKMASIAVERKCDRFDWAVLNWNKPSIEFYKSIGAEPMDEWTVFRLTGEALNKLGS
ncbi:MAG: GNAT family N-acetyltransferase [Bacteroidales bacterium]|nr:GNAT family N-acetyltransferase [Bacteroidales bacterium]